MHLGWNSQLNKFGILNDMGLWVLHGLHNGDRLSVEIGGEWVSTTLEFGNGEWSLANTNLVDKAIEGISVKLRYQFM